MAMALRPRLSPKSMASRYGSQALGRLTTAESVITSLAGFEVAFAFPLLGRFSGLGLQLGSTGPGITGMAGFAAPESVITSLAGFGSHRPQPLGTHRNPRRFQVGAGGFTTDAGRLLDAPQRPAQPSQ